MARNVEKEEFGRKMWVLPLGSPWGVKLKTGYTLDEGSYVTAKHTKLKSGKARNVEEEAFCRNCVQGFCPPPRPPLGGHHACHKHITPMINIQNAKLKGVINNA